MSDWLLIYFYTRQDVSFAHSRLWVFRQYTLIARLLLSCNRHLPRLFSIFLNIASFSTVFTNHTLQHFRISVGIATRLRTGRLGFRIPSSANYSAMFWQALGINQPHIPSVSGIFPERGKAALAWCWPPTPI